MFLETVVLLLIHANAVNNFVFNKLFNFTQTFQTTY